MQIGIQFWTTNKTVEKVLNEGILDLQSLENKIIFCKMVEIWLQLEDKVDFFDVETPWEELPIDDVDKDLFTLYLQTMNEIVRSVSLEEYAKKMEIEKNQVSYEEVFDYWSVNHGLDIMCLVWTQFPGYDY